MEYVVLSGGKGFLGSRVVSKILQETNFGLILPVRNPFTARENNEDSDRIKYVDSNNLNSQCNSLGVKIIGAIHTATEYGRLGNQIESVLTGNIVLPVKILHLIHEHNASFFINAESFFNKFPNSYPHFADYSNSKRALHYWLNGFSEDVRIINLYLEHIYGPGDSIEKFVPRLLSDLRSSTSNPILLSNGDQKRDFVFIDDAAEAFLNAIYLTSSLDFGVFNFEIGTGIATSIKDFSLRMKSATNSKRDIVFGALPYRKDEIMTSFANTDNNRELNWMAKVSLEIGISKLVSNE